MRKLASIQRIAALLPIPGADKIEVAQIGGWNVVVKKGEFSVGDLGVYFEIDSFLPAEHPAFAFLAKDAKERDGVQRVRLKTIRLRKQLSQGLILPISAFPELSKSVLGLRVLTEGDDVSELLNVEKYEPPEERAANGGPADHRSRTSQWPFFIQKTDQERAQNAVPQIERAAAAGESFEVTTKLDGSSMTVYALMPDSPYYAEAKLKRDVCTRQGKSWVVKLWALVKGYFKPVPKEPIFGVCSRNIEVDIDGSTTFAQYVREHGIIEKIAAVAATEGSLAFQGELIAPSIQGNYEKVEKPEWYVYDVYEIDKQVYKLPAVARVFTIEANLDYVPVVSVHANLWQEGEDASGRAIVDKLLLDAEGPGMNPGVKREGRVYKSNTAPFSFKCISNSYLEHKG
jgi:RNA ligase (TIGR02306 family)